MKLSRALKEKNRLIRKITIFKNRILVSNVVLLSNDFPYNMDALQTMYKSLVKILIELKVLIQIANQPILKKIYALGELKSGIAILSELDVTEGEQEPLYGNSDLRTYKVQLNRVQIDISISKFQEEIDTLQDEIDEFNAITTIDFQSLNLDKLDR